MADPATTQMLTKLLAGQERADQQHAAVMARLGDLEEVQRQQIAAIVGLKDAFATLRETVDKLTEAANAEPKKKGGDIAKALEALAKVVAEGNVMIGRAALGVQAMAEALPGALEDAALRAVELAKGGVEPPNGHADGS